jgi:hypothetical protein
MKIAILVMLLCMFLVSCTPQDVPLEKLCQVDADCVAAQCCHPTDVVNKENAPDCEDVACTLSCEENTLDCGQGEIKCIANVCTAVLNA